LTGSFDRGLHSDLLRALVLHPQRPASLYLGGTAGFFRSRDAGDRWLRLGTGLPDAEVHLLVLVAPSTLVAAVRTASGGSSLWKSPDLGASWQPAENGLPGGAALYQLAADPRRPATLYAATEKGVFVTDDAAASWQPLNAGLPVPVLSLAVDPHDPRQLYAGSLFRGLFTLPRSDR